MPPIVSVVIPNYNHASYLRRRIDSVLGQTFTDFEVVILDDASTDSSRDVIEDYRTDPRVTIHLNGANSGSPFVQWNRGVSLGRGRYIWIAESDDFADPAFLAFLVPLLEADPGCAVAYCQSWLVDETSQTIGTMADLWDPALQPQRWERPFANDGRDECSRFLIWKNTIPNASAAVFRKEAYLAAGGAPESMRLCGDWFLWTRLLTRGGIVYVPERLNYFRKHTSTVRATTAWESHAQEQWQTQTAIVQSCRVPFATRQRLARRTLDQLLDLTLPAPKDQRRARLQRYLRTAGPILRAGWWGTASGFLTRRFRRKIRTITPAASRD